MICINGANVTIYFMSPVLILEENKQNVILIQQICFKKFHQKKNQFKNIFFL